MRTANPTTRRAPPRRPNKLQISLQCSRDEYERICARASMLGLSVSAFLRMRALQAP